MASTKKYLILTMIHDPLGNFSTLYTVAETLEKAREVKAKMLAPDSNSGAAKCLSCYIFKVKEIE